MWITILSEDDKCRSRVTIYDLKRCRTLVLGIRFHRILVRFLDHGIKTRLTVGSRQFYRRNISASYESRPL